MATYARANVFPHSTHLKGFSFVSARLLSAISLLRSSPRLAEVAYGYENALRDDLFSHTSFGICCIRKDSRYVLQE